MSLTARPFDNRLKKIVRRHNRLGAAGVVHKVDSRGLIVARPRIYSPKFPLKGLLLLVAAGFVFKGLVFANLGAGAYNGHVTELRTGSMVEQVGAWVMQPDPATMLIGKGFDKLGL
jgi:hypothetical protein